MALKSKEGQAGFTLVELLVALFLLGLLMFTAYGTLSFSASALERNIAVADRNEEITQVQKFIRRTVGNIIPSRSNLTGSEKYMKFKTSMVKDGIRSPFEVELLIESNDLVLKWTKLDNRVNMTSGARINGSGRVVLLENIDDISLMYGGKNFADNRIWQPLWSNSNEMPKYLKIDVEREQFWPEMIIEINVTHTIDCWYDPVSRGCQYR